VVGSPLDVIASGPTAPDPTTYADALGVVGKYGGRKRVPAAVLERLERGARGLAPETPKPGDAVFERVQNLLVGSNALAVEAAAEVARAAGLHTAVMSTFVEGEAREIGKALAAFGKEVAANGRPVHRPACLLFGGETTVTVRGSGKGGRNGEVALGAALALRGMGPDVVVVSFATDGGDGDSPGAGAIADGTAIDRAIARGLDPQAHLDNNDSYTFWHTLGDAIETGPTGTHVNDIMAVFVF
jgi:hydroxypyruvate reductase